MTRPTIDSLWDRIEQLREEGEAVLIKARSLHSQLMMGGDGRALQAAEETKLCACLDLACSLTGIILNDASRASLLSLQPATPVAYRKTLSALSRLLGGVPLAQLASLLGWDDPKHSLVIRSLEQEISLHAMTEPLRAAGIAQALLGLRQTRPGHARVAQAACLTEAEVKLAAEQVKQLCASTLNALKADAALNFKEKKPKNAPVKKSKLEEPVIEATEEETKQSPLLFYSMRPMVSARDTPAYQAYLEWLQAVPK